MVINSESSKEIDLHLNTRPQLARTSSPSIALSDIPQILADWENMLQIGDLEQVRQKISFQAEMCRSAGDELGIPEFVNIAQVTISVLAEQPSLTLTVAKLSLAGLQAAYEAKVSQLHLSEGSDSLSQIESIFNSYDESNLDSSVNLNSEDFIESISLSFLDDDESDLLSPSITVEDLIQGYAPEEELLLEDDNLPAPTPAQIPLTESLRFPLQPYHLNTENLLIWQSQNLVFAIHSHQVLDTFEFNTTYDPANGSYPTFITWEDQKVRLFQIEELFKYRHFASSKLLLGSGINDIIHQPTGSLLIILKVGGEVIAIAPVIERLVSEKNLQIKPFGLVLLPPEYIFGCALIEQDKILPAVNVLNLVESRINLLNTGFSQPTILIVDDSKTVREVLRITLQEAHYQVLSAENGEQAIQCCQEHPKIDLIICDLEMPKVNGFEFLIYRRQQPNLQDIPAIMLTFRDSDRERKLAMQLGAAAYLNKPYLKEDLLSTIKGILSRK